MTGLLAGVLTLVVAGLVGLGSALLPLVNAEAYAAVGSVRVDPGLMVLFVLALAAGQTAGKLLLYESARRCLGRSDSRRTARVRGSRWCGPVVRWLRSPRTAVPVLLASATVGLPPLAVVSLAAGAAGQDRRVFAVMCFAGRTVRFGLLVLPAATMLRSGS